jgi:Rieske 2Fe-2S family protein
VRSESAGLAGGDWVRDVGRSLAEARNLPGFVYHDPGVFAAEQELLFGRRWFCVGRQQELGEPGSFVTVELADESIVLTCDSAGRRHAFYNTCRHRGTRLVEAERGEACQTLVCPYHAWCYGLDGALKAAPGMDVGGAFRAEEHGLARVRLEVWQGWLFVCFDDGAPPLAETLADAPDLGAWGMLDLQRGDRRVYEVAANWKILCENYSECYHCATVHPELHRITHLGSSRDPVEGTSYNGGPMDLREGCDTMSSSGRSPRPPLPGLGESERRVVHYYVLYPNLLLSPHPDYVMSHLVVPLSAERSRVICEWHFDPVTVAAEGFDASDAVEFWDRVNRQDWQLCEGVQRGAHSRGNAPGPYQSTEDCVQFFDRWYVRSMGFVED